MDALTAPQAGAPPPRFIDGAGTSEWSWLGGHRFDDIQPLDVEGLALRHRTAWVFAPHPDDEVLGVGGLMARLAALRTSVRVVSVTDGGASHPGSTRWTPDVLARVRAEELSAALEDLGAEAAPVRLGIADGAVGVHREEIERFVASRCGPDDLLLTTWRLDGHPDHEACGDAVTAAADRIGARVLEYPVWAWHWASPVAPGFPWARALRVDLDTNLRVRKRAAIGNFTSQLADDDHRPAVLPPHVLERFHRPFEVVFG